MEIRKPPIYTEEDQKEDEELINYILQNSNIEDLPETPEESQEPLNLYQF